MSEEKDQDIDEQTPDDKAGEDAFSSGFGEEVEPRLEPPPLKDQPEQTSMGDEDEVNDPLGDEVTHDELGEDLPPEDKDKAKADADADNADSADDQRGNEETKRRKGDLSNEAVLKAENDALERRMRAMEGRMGSMHQQMEAMKRAGQQAVQKTQQATGDTTGERGTGTHVPTDEQINAALADPEDMKALEGEFPEFAKILGGIISGVEKRLTNQPSLEQLQETIASTVQQRMDAMEHERVNATIASRHSDWVGVIKSTGYNTWMGMQDEETQAAGDTSDPEVLVGVLDKYKAFRQWYIENHDDLRGLPIPVAVDRYQRANAESGATDDETARRKPASQSSRDKRLQANRPATTPRGSQRQAAPPSADKAFEEGFNS